MNLLRMCHAHVTQTLVCCIAEFILRVPPTVQAPRRLNSAMRQTKVWPGVLALASLGIALNQTFAAPFDAAPFAQPLPEGAGLIWEDPREIHKVIVNFVGPAPAPDH